MELSPGIKEGERRKRVKRWSDFLFGRLFARVALAEGEVWRDGGSQVAVSSPHSPVRRLHVDRRIDGVVAVAKPKASDPCVTRKTRHRLDEKERGDGGWWWQVVGGGGGRARVGLVHSVTFCV